jgi:hypothetical protein
LHACSDDARTCAVAAGHCSADRTYRGRARVNPKKALTGRFFPIPTNRPAAGQASPFARAAEAMRCFIASTFFE